MDTSRGDDISTVFPGRGRLVETSVLQLPATLTPLASSPPLGPLSQREEREEDDASALRARLLNMIVANEKSRRIHPTPR